MAARAAARNRPDAFNFRGVRCQGPRMAQFFGVFTVRLTEGLAVVEPVLLEMTPFASTPEIVKV